MTTTIEANAKKVTIGDGNEKLGKVKTFSLPAKISCPGKTKECEKICYVKYLARFSGVFPAYRKNFDVVRKNRASFVQQMIERIGRSKSKNFRIHVSGDFFSSSYVWDWIKIAKALPDVRFWTYTRSWKIKKIRDQIYKLKKLPNVQIFASVDTCDKKLPKNWRIAWIDNDERKNGLVCKEQDKKSESCEECKYCFVGNKNDVIFKKH